MMNPSNVPEFNGTYKEKARMRSLLKCVVIRKLQLKLGGMYWYKANPEPLRRLVFDTCENYPLNTRAEHRLDALADDIIKIIESSESWLKCTNQQKERMNRLRSEHDE